MQAATDSRHRIRGAMVHATRETAPMLVGLALVAAALLAVISLGMPARAPSPSVAAGANDGFHFEQVGIGIRWLVDDGAGNRPQDEVIAFEPDGSVLTCCDYPNFLFGDTKHYELARLGNPEPAARWAKAQLNLMGRVATMAVGPDDSLWLAGEVLASLDNGEWRQYHIAGPSRVLEVQPDGTIWAGVDGDSAAIARIRDGRKRVYKTGRGLPQATATWGSRVTGIAATPDGRVWVGVGAANAKRPGGLLRYDGEGWDIVRPLGRGVDVSVEGVATEPDGTLWVYLSRDAHEGGTKREISHLARLDVDGWTVLNEEDGVPQQRPRRARDIDTATLMQAGPDGIVWLTHRTGRDCRGLSSFDGASSRSHLPDGACVQALEVAPDGTAWVSMAWTDDDVEQAHWSDGQYRYRSGIYLVEP